MLNNDASVSEINVICNFPRKPHLVGNEDTGHTRLCQQALAERAPQVLGEHYAIHYPGYQWSTSRNLRQSPLHAQRVKHNAYFGQVFGWERPLYFNEKSAPVLTMKKPAWFNKVGNEVRQAHTAAAVFDSSTFGKIAVSGPGAGDFLNRICANDMLRAPGSVLYSALLNDRGGYESDLTALRIDTETYHLYTGTAAIKRDISWLQRHITDQDQVHIEDITEQLAVLALMGPKTSTIAVSLGVEELNDLPFYQHIQTDLSGITIRAANLSYVGEPGWELTCKASDAEQLLSLLISAGATPAGSFAQTSMRIEKGFLAYGHDLDTDINPLQAGMEKTIDWKSNFIGREALLELKKKPPVSRIASIILDDDNAVPLGNEPVYLGSEIIGKTTSAAYGYRVNAPVALALITNNLFQSRIPDHVHVDIAGRQHEGELIIGPALVKA